MVSTGLSTLIQWIGHACFLVVTVTNVHILIDPVSPQVGYSVPEHTIPADIVFISHNDSDDNYIALASDVPTPPSVVQPRTTPGYSDGVYGYTLADGTKETVPFRRIFAYRDNVNGKQRGIDTITVFTIDGMHFCHLGGLGQSELTAKQIELIGPVDILMIPTGGDTTIDAKAATHIVKQLQPKVIIPMQFRTQYVNQDLQAKLHPLDESVAALGPKVGVLAGDSNVLVLTQQTLPKTPTLVKFKL